MPRKWGAQRARQTEINIRKGKKDPKKKLKPSTIWGRSPVQPHFIGKRSTPGGKVKLRPGETVKAALGRLEGQSKVEKPGKGTKRIGK